MSTMTDRVWEYAAREYQPTRAEYDGPTRRMVDHGPRMPMARALGARDFLALLTAARIVDTAWTPRITSAMVARVLGIAQSQANKSLTRLTELGIMTHEPVGKGLTKTKYYEITGV